MWFRSALRPLLLLAVSGLLLWACHLTSEEQPYLDVRADSTWMGFDAIAVVLAEKDGAPIDTLFKGKLANLDQLKKLPVPGYDGREVRVILVGFKNGKPAKTETRPYDGHTQSGTGPKVVVILLPDDTVPVNPGDSALDLKPDTLRLYAGGPSAVITPAGSAWAGKTLAWASSDPKIAAVAGGTVTPIGPGRASIRAQGGKAADSSWVTVVRDVPLLDAGPDTAVGLNAAVAFKVKVQQEFGGVSAFKWSLDGDTAWDDSSAGMPSQASLLATPARTFAQAGVFLLRFLVRDGEGNEAVAVRALVVSSQVPRIVSLEKDAKITEGDSVSFTGKAEVNAGSLRKYAWNYGDGSPSAAGALSAAIATIAGGHRFARSGNFKVTLTIEDDAGTAVSGFVQVQVDPRIRLKPPIALAGKDTTVSLGSQARLNGTASDSDGTVAKLEWSIGGAAFARSSGDTSFVPTAAGSLRCILRATDNDGLVGLDTVVLTVTQAPPPVIPSFSPSDTTISINDSVTFAATVTASAPLDSYSWDFNGDEVPDQVGTLTGTAASLKAGKRYLAAGTFLAALKVTDQSGNSQAKQAKVLVETDPPAADAGKDTSVDANTRANLHGKASDKLGKVAKTEWKIGAGAYAVAPPETSITAPALGGVTLACILRVTDDDGGRDSDTVIVTVKPSTDATLKTLTTSSGTLAPVFTPAGPTYTASVPEAVASITVTATANSAGALITVNATGTTSGSPSAPISLAVGPNTITIAVTAQDKIAKKTYTLTVTRLDQTPPAAPLVSGTTPSASATPTWTWISGGGGNGNYRYKLDNSDLTAGATAATARTFTPISALADGIHELYVQERDSAGNWSATGSFKIAVTVGPVSWYKFDGNLKDSGPNLNHGVASGGVAFIADHAGVANRAVSFQSGNGQMETGDAAIRLGSAFTVSAWVLVRDSADLQYFMDAGNGGFGMASTYGSVAFVMIGGTTNNANCYVGIGQWAHITGTYNGTDIKIYKNGVLQQTTIEPKPGIDWTPGNLLLGFHNSTYWTGALDDVRFYNRLLSQAEITAIANGSM